MIDFLVCAALLATTAWIAAIMARDAYRAWPRIVRLRRSRPSRQLADAQRRADEIHALQEHQQKDNGE